MNVFSALQRVPLTSYPRRFETLCVFLQLTDCEGQGLGQIRGRRLETDEVAFASEEHPIAFSGRLQIKFVNFRLVRRCVFPAPGVNCIQFFYGGQWVAEQALTVPG
jgi:hypothetical protein